MLRYVELDVAATLRIGQVAAGLRLTEALRLHEVLTRTLAGLRAGAVLVPQALVLLHQTRSCSEQVAADAERRVFTGLGPDGLAPWFAGALTRRVTRAVLQAQAALEPDGTAQRQADARAGRRVVVRPEPDAMGSLWALLPAEQLRAFTVGLDVLAARQQHADRAAGVDRTADQRRADLLAMLPALALHALDGTTPSPDGGHPAVVVNVHLPMATALGRSDAPGLLDGYGPLSAARCRLLLPGARLRRVLVDQHTGEALHVTSRTSPTPSTSPGPSPSPSPSPSSARRDPAGTSRPDGTGELTRRDRRHGPLPAQPSGQGLADEGLRPQAAPAPRTEVGMPQPVGRAGPTGPAGRAGSGGGTGRDGFPQRHAPADDGADQLPDGADSARRALPDGPLRRALLALVPDRPVLLDDTPEPHYRPSGRSPGWCAPATRTAPAWAAPARPAAASSTTATPGRSGPPAPATSPRSASAATTPRRAAGGCTATPTAAAPGPAPPDGATARPAPGPHRPTRTSTDRHRHPGHRPAALAPARRRRTRHRPGPHLPARPGDRRRTA